MSHVSYRQIRLFGEHDADAVDTSSNTAAPLAVAAPLGASDIAMHEVGLLPARLLGDLPAPTTCVCATVDGAPVVLTTSAAVYAEVARSVPTFVGREVAALALAAEHERASAAVFAQWCERKRDSHRWRLGADEAIGRVPGVFMPRGWSLARVLGWYAVRVVTVEVGDVVPALGVTCQR